MTVERLKYSDRNAGWFRWVRILILLVIVPALLVLSYAGFNLQGYQDDLETRPLETWPFGATSLVLAVVLARIALRAQLPGRLHFALVGLAVVAMVLSLWHP